MSITAVVALAVFGGYQLRGARASGIPGPNTLSYSATLINNGQPDNGSHFILLKLWEKGNASAACATIPGGNTNVVNGRFTIPLDSSCVPVIHQSPDVEVEVVVDGTSMGKTALAAVPYAVEADTASNFAPGSAIAQLVPPGTVVPYAGVIGGAVKPPPGWLLCDGAEVNRALNSTLFAAIGTGWGSGDGATTFNTPDLRGVFLRGVDVSGLKDPDANSRTAIQSGGNTGAKVGTAEDSAFASHDHVLTDPGHSHYMNPPIHSGWGNWSYGGNNWAAQITNSPGDSTTVSTTGITLAKAGGSETRPVNAAVNYIIKL
jgi:microcystin-dependent protein